jgi:hypothetical protein
VLLKMALAPSSTPNISMIPERLTVCGTEALLDFDEDRGFLGA